MFSSPCGKELAVFAVLCSFSLLYSLGWVKNGKGVYYSQSSITEFRDGEKTNFENERITLSMRRGERVLDPIRWEGYYSTKQIHIWVQPDNTRQLIERGVIHWLGP